MNKSVKSPLAILRNAFWVGWMEKFGYSTPLHKNTGGNKNYIKHTDHCFIPRKHCQFSMAGLLTCNIFAALPVRCWYKQWALLAKTFLCYLQLRDS